TLSALVTISTSLLRRTAGNNPPVIRSFSAEFQGKTEFLGTIPPAARLIGVTRANSSGPRLCGTVRGCLIRPNYACWGGWNRPTQASYVLRSLPFVPGPGRPWHCARSPASPTHFAERGRPTLEQSVFRLVTLLGRDRPPPNDPARGPRC